jgi:hypothetical protein
MSGSTNYGLIENAITHPANGLFIDVGYGNTSLVPYNNLTTSNNNANSS